MSIPKTPDKNKAVKSNASASTPAKKQTLAYSDGLKNDKPASITQELEAEAPNEAGALDDTSFTTKVISEALSHLDPQTRLQAALLATRFLSLTCTHVDW